MHVCLLISVIASLSVGMADDSSARHVTPAKEPSISGLDFRDTSLIYVLEQLGRTKGVNIVVNWRGLYDAGVFRDSPVTLNARDIPLDRALRLVLMQVQRPTGQPVDYALTGKVARIDTRDGLLVTRAFVCGRLLHEPRPAWPGRPLRLTLERIHRRRGAELIRAIRSTVDPESWIGAVGGASIAVAGDTLVVRQTPNNLERIARLVERMHDAAQ